MFEVRFGTRKGIAREAQMEGQECGRAAALLQLRSASSQGVGGAPEQVVDLREDCLSKGGMLSDAGPGWESL